MKRRTEITIEIERVIEINQSGDYSAWCTTCGAKASMVPVKEAAEMLSVKESVIYRLVEAGRLHFAATTEGMLLICPDSLLALKNDAIVQPAKPLLITDGEVLAD